MIVALDFDGVIHDVANPLPGRRMGLPLAGAREALEALQHEGHKLIIHTVRGKTESGIRSVADWMRYYELPELPITATKPNADAFVDDKALRHVNWEETLGELLPERRNALHRATH